MHEKRGESELKDADEKENSKNLYLFVSETVKTTYRCIYISAARTK